MATKTRKTASTTPPPAPVPSMPPPPQAVPKPIVPDAFMDKYWFYWQNRKAEPTYRIHSTFAFAALASITWAILFLLRFFNPLAPIFAGMGIMTLVATLIFFKERNRFSNWTAGRRQALAVITRAILWAGITAAPAMFKLPILTFAVGLIMPWIISAVTLFRPSWMVEFGRGQIYFYRQHNKPDDEFQIVGRPVAPVDPVLRRKIEKYLDNGKEKVNNFLKFGTPTFMEARLEKEYLTKRHAEAQSLADAVAQENYNGTTVVTEVEDLRELYPEDHADFLAFSAQARAVAPVIWISPMDSIQLVWALKDFLWLNFQVNQLLSRDNIQFDLNLTFAVLPDPRNIGSFQLYYNLNAENLRQIMTGAFEKAVKLVAFEYFHNLDMDSAFTVESLENFRHLVANVKLEAIEQNLGVAIQKPTVQGYPVLPPGYLEAALQRRTADLSADGSLAQLRGYMLYLKGLGLNDQAIGEFVYSSGLLSQMKGRVRVNNPEKVVRPSEGARNSQPPPALPPSSPPPQINSYNPPRRNDYIEGEVTEYDMP